MPIFNFARLVNKYSVDCVLVTVAQGEYVAGEYVEGAAARAPIRAAVISMSQSKIYQSGGRLTSADRTMYVLTAQDQIDLESSNSYYLEHGGSRYKVEAAGLYGEDYADFNEYTLRKVDSFYAGENAAGL